jgi:four helix bundle protein
MATLNSFEDLECWKSARVLTRLIYKIFNESRDFGFKDQIQRASVSIMNNIAEGFGRIGVKEKLQFTNIAVGSAQEVKSMLFLAQDL